MWVNFLPVVYVIAVILLLLQAFRVMFNGLVAANSPSKKNYASKGDRTGRLTVHPELLNKEGEITDEDLLTVRFTNDSDPPKSTGRSSD